MKTKPKIVILMLICAVTWNIFSCSSKDKKEISAAVQQEIIVPDETKSSGVAFSLIKRVKVDGLFCHQISVSSFLDRVYVYGDAIAGTPQILVKIYNLEIDYLSEKVFNIGQGPGDLGLINVLTPIGSKILVTENSNSRVSTYNRDLAFQDTVKVPLKVGAPFGLLNEGRHFIGVPVTSEGKEFIYPFKLVSFPGMKEKIFLQKKGLIPDFNKGIWVIDDLTHFSYFSKDQTIYFLYMKDYEILTLNPEGERTRDILVKFRPIRTLEDKKEEYALDQFFKSSDRLRFTFGDTVIPTSWMIPLEKGFVVLRRKDYSLECTGPAEGDYFSYGIEYRGKVKVPCFFWMYRLSMGIVLGMRNCVYDNGFLYLVNEVDEELWLEKWEVKE